MLSFALFVVCRLCCRLQCLFVDCVVYGLSTMLFDCLTAHGSASLTSISHNLFQFSFSRSHSHSRSLFSFFFLILILILIHKLITVATCIGMSYSPQSCQTPGTPPLQANKSLRVMVLDSRINGTNLIQKTTAESLKGYVKGNEVVVRRVEVCFLFVWFWFRCFGLWVDVVMLTLLMLTH